VISPPRFQCFDETAHAAPQCFQCLEARIVQETSYQPGGRRVQRREVCRKRRIRTTNDVAAARAA
jgi:hypothetical protein